jgi:hypothetical protein
MQTIEPYFRWKNKYSAYEDRKSPFFGHKHDPYLCRNTIYNHYIHPDWDEFGSNTLYLKLLFSNYQNQAVIIELFGEWNDCLYNDIMFLKRNVIEHLEKNGITKFLLIGENVLNFHYSDDSYYEDWFNDLDDGWIIAINFRQHVLKEFDKIGLYNYLLYGGHFNDIKWRTYDPARLIQSIDLLFNRSLRP